MPSCLYFFEIYQISVHKMKHNASRLISNKVLEPVYTNSAAKIINISESSKLFRKILLRFIQKRGTDISLFEGAK